MTNNNTKKAQMPGTPTDKKRLEYWVTGILVIFFLFKLLYFAFTIGQNVPPDEITHVGISQLYAKNIMFVKDSPETYQFGPVTHIPYLYHFLMGKMLRLNLLRLSHYEYLRMLNIILAMLTLFFSFKLVSLLSKNSLEKILFFVMLTNTLMFTFISFSVNYDNLVNLCAVSSIYYLFLFLKKQEPKSILIFTVFVLAGSLTKISFLPLALILFMLYFANRKYSIIEDGKSIVRNLKSFNTVTFFLSTLVIVLMLANIGLYGKNIVLYGKTIPSCEQVLEKDSCLENRIYARERILKEYRDGTISHEEAIKKTNIIKSAGDRAHALRLIENERNYQRFKPKAVNRFDYVQMVTKNAIKPTIFGIQAHLSMLKSPNELLPYSLLIFLAFVLWVRYVRFDKSGQLWNYLAIIFGFYFLFLIGIHNYNIYLSTHALYLGVQGRYLFPVIVPLYLLTAHYLIHPLRKSFRIIVIISACILFIWGDFPYFLNRKTDDWHKKIQFQGELHEKYQDNFLTTMSA